MISDLERALCRRIPQFSCLPGCNECCSQSWRVSFNRFGDIVARQDDPPWICENAQDGQCAIYSDRPTVCRLFFCSELLPPCPKGLGPERLMTVRETREFVRIWHRLLNGDEEEEEE